MKVKHLLEILKQYNPNSNVNIHIPARYDSFRETNGPLGKYQGGFITDLECVDSRELNDGLPDEPIFRSKYYFGVGEHYSKLEWKDIHKSPFDK